MINLSCLPSLGFDRLKIVDPSARVKTERERGMAVAREVEDWKWISRIR